MKVRAIKPPKYSINDKSKSIQKLYDEIERKSNEFMQKLSQEPPLPPRDEFRININSNDFGIGSSSLTPNMQSCRTFDENCKATFGNVASTKNLVNYSSSISSMFKNENPIANRIYSCNNAEKNNSYSQSRKEIKNVCKDIWNSRLETNAPALEVKEDNITQNKNKNKKFCKKDADNVVKRLYKEKPKYDLNEVMKQKNQIDQELSSFTHSPMINK